MKEKGQKGNVKVDNGPKRSSVFVREFELADNPEVQRIFHKGVMEMIPDTAFRALKHHPESLLLYAAMTTVCFVITMSWWMIGLVPLAVLWMRYFYSRRVVHDYLKHAKSGDMGDIEGFYMKPPDSCLWVAELEGRVVGVIAADGQRKQSGALELRRMSVDRDCRRRGIGMVLGRKLLEFAAARGYSSVFLGTTGYSPAAHQLYKQLGFRCVGVTNGYAPPGVKQSLLEQVGAATSTISLLSIYLYELSRENAEADEQEINLVARTLRSLTKAQVAAHGRAMANAVVLQHHLFLASQRVETKAERDLLFRAISFDLLFGDDWRRMTKKLANAEEDRKIFFLLQMKKPEPKQHSTPRKGQQGSRPSSAGCSPHHVSATTATLASPWRESQAPHTVRSKGQVVPHNG